MELCAAVAWCCCKNEMAANMPVPVCVQLKFKCSCVVLGPLKCMFSCGGEKWGVPHGFIVLYRKYFIFEI